MLSIIFCEGCGLSVWFIVLGGLERAATTRATTMAIRSPKQWWRSFFSYARIFSSLGVYS
jgi:hypothetical protein